MFFGPRKVQFDQESRAALDRLSSILALLTTTVHQKKETDMAVIAEVQTLISSNQTLIALVNQLIAKLSTPPVPSVDITDTAAAASSEQSAVNAAIAAANAALNPPAQPTP